MSKGKQRDDPSKQLLRQIVFTTGSKNLPLPSWPLVAIRSSSERIVFMPSFCPCPTRTRNSGRAEHCWAARCGCH